MPQLRSPPAATKTQRNQINIKNKQTNKKQQSKMSAVIVPITMNEIIWLLIRNRLECDGKKVIMNSNYFSLDLASEKKEKIICWSCCQKSGE